MVVRVLLGGGEDVGSISQVAAMVAQVVACKGDEVVFQMVDTALPQSYYSISIYSVLLTSTSGMSGFHLGVAIHLFGLLW